LPSSPIGVIDQQLSIRSDGEQFHFLVDSVEEYAIYMLDPNGNVVTWNTGAQKNQKATRQKKLSGKTLPAFYTAEDLPLTSRSATW